MDKAHRYGQTARNTLDFGVTESPPNRDSSCFQTAIPTQALGQHAWWTDKELLIMLQELLTLANGKMGSRMGLAMKSGLITRNTKDSSSRDLKKDWACLNGKTARRTMENGLRTSCTGSGSINGLTVAFITDKALTASFMVSVGIPGPIRGATKANTATTWNMGSAFTRGLKVKSTKETG